MQNGAYIAGVITFAKTDFGTTMRATPVVTIGTNSNSNVTGISVGAINNDGVYASGSATAAGNWGILLTYTASADL